MELRAFPHPWTVPERWGTAVPRFATLAGHGLEYLAIAAAVGEWMTTRQRERFASRQERRR